MAKENSFDIVSKTDYAEVTNALNQTEKEVSQRFDFKGSKAGVVLQDKDLLMTAEDDTRLRNMNDILQTKLLKRGISLKALDYQKIEPAAGGTVRQVVKIQQGIPIEKAKEVVKFIKDAKLKVQASIQGETVRVSGKDRDTLQDTIAKLKTNDSDRHQFDISVRTKHSNDSRRGSRGFAMQNCSRDKRTLPDRPIAIFGMIKRAVAC